MRMVFPNHLSSRFFDELASDMNDLVGTILGEQTKESSSAHRPAMDIEESETGYAIFLDVPGVSFDDLQIEVQEGFLNIRGARPKPFAEDDGCKRRVERFHGDFERKVRVPKDVDLERIEADYKDGVLTVSLPKLEKKEPTKIQIKYRDSLDTTDKSGD